MISCCVTFAVCIHYHTAKSIFASNREVTGCPRILELRDQRKFLEYLIKKVIGIIMSQVGFSAKNNSQPVYLKLISL